MEDRAQLQWVPELSLLEFRAVGGQEDEPVAAAWIQGPSAAAGRLRARAAEIARGGFIAAVLSGEPGTGKHRIAQFIHRQSRRANHPLTTLDGGAQGLEDQLVHLRDIISGQTPGVQPGNLVIRDLHRASTAAIQRLLELLTIQGVELRCGLILMTSEPLASLRARSLEHGQLLGRAASAVLEVAPLRNRRADVPILARAFLDEAAKRYNRQIRGISPQAISRLERHDFPGNLRELAAVIEQAVLRGSGDWLTADCLAGIATEERDDPGERAEVVIRMPGSSLREIELQALRLALRLAGGRVVRASELLGITRHALRRKLEKYGLSDLRYRARREPVPNNNEDDAFI